MALLIGEQSVAEAKALTFAEALTKETDSEP